MPPDFLSLDEIIEIHTDQIARYGGEAGLRDAGLLQSAVFSPQTTFDGKFLHDGIYSMAAAYLFHLVQNHAFVDGNKRVGTVAALVFLSINDVEVTADEDQLATFVAEVAQGKHKKPAIAEYLQKNSS
jgi:death on curing protein